MQTESNGQDLPVSSMPLHHSICWRPLADSYYLLAAVLGDRRTHYPLFITQPALREVEDQRQAVGEEAPVVGRLGGVLARTPGRGLVYPTVTRLVPVQSDRSAESGREAFRQAVRRTRVHLAACGEEILGWYRSREHVGRRLTPGDERVTLDNFAQPWQATLVISADGAGGFFRFKREAARSFAIPFYELMDDERPPVSDSSVLSFRGYAPTSRAAYPDAAPVELEDALRLESEEELGPLGRRFLRQLRGMMKG
jgi:hypothetical protein